MGEELAFFIERPYFSCIDRKLSTLASQIENRIERERKKKKKYRF
jgi:hypothetical protein